MRRFTRLTNAFSKKVDNHAAAIALHFMYYNFVRIHQTLKMTPAMAAGVTTKLWEISEIVEFVKFKLTHYPPWAMSRWQKSNRACGPLRPNRRRNG